MSNYKQREAVFDFDSIRAHMSKDVEIFTPTRKDPVKKAKVKCGLCHDQGWFSVFWKGKNVWTECDHCENPDDKTRPLTAP